MTEQFNTEDKLIQSIPILLAEAKLGTFIVFLLSKNSDQSFKVVKKLDFKNADEQFEYLWSTRQDIELIYLSMSNLIQRVCYRGKRKSVAYDLEKGRPKIVLYENENFKYEKAVCF